jgi:beta-lactamase class D
MTKILLLFILTIWSTNSFGQIDYQSYFEDSGLTGSTTIYDYNNKKWIFTDKQDAEAATLPASTFKIHHSLIALEYNSVQNEMDENPNFLSGRKEITKRILDEITGTM